MLHEPGLSFDDRPAHRPTPAPEEPDGPQTELRAIVDSVMTVQRFLSPTELNSVSAREDMLLLQTSQQVGGFEGVIRLPYPDAYDKLDGLMKPHDLLPMLRHRDGLDLIVVVRGRPHVHARPPWLNIILFIATTISLLMVGTLIAAGEASLADPALGDVIANNLLPNLWRGIPYAGCLLLILGAHELGHYFAARHHHLQVTLPYFIPLPPPFSLFGTAGAFIQLREPLRNRKALLDVGASGPLIGLAFAIPILLIGLSLSPVEAITSTGLVEGNSLLYALSKTIVFGRFLPSAGMDVTLNQIAMAGWTGLLVTAINLIPLGQLDGGHILYSLIGDRARLLYIPVLVATTALTIFVSESWLLWLVILFIFGRFYAVPLDSLSRLDRRRKVVGIIALLVFVVTFVPVPFALRVVDSTSSTRDSVALMLPIALALGWLWQRARAAYRSPAGSV